MKITEKYLIEHQFLPINKEGYNPVYRNVRFSCILIKDGELYIPYVGINVSLHDISQLQPCKQIASVEQLEALLGMIERIEP